ncbi:hypothetical protein Rsub_05837 [Raphidocelis subcapitata]|uniref:GST C-terminal domain-containing protein n=1 Tax=Raphidocelis subcapitata TaxID=307507 RepID=A0A2V0NZD6_9CHLO|nr:hypothetical protein Rsub_05837 [Raphidocelis subcapitata]|eukprot:GBF93001.1 hypothetical protein Rsub_05837 [Raphidocelis subcapitata]
MRAFVSPCCTSSAARRRPAAAAPQRPAVPAPARARGARSAMAADGGEPWRLYYWPGVKGRGEYVRLCFADAGAPLDDVAYTAAAERPAAAAGRDWASYRGSAGFKAVVDFCFTRPPPGAPLAHAPVRAPPVLARGGGGGPGGGGAGFALCNTPAICSYLNGVFGWAEALTPEQRARVDQILSVILSDAVGEGRLAFHPVKFYGSHAEQVEESKPYIAEYGTQRLPKYVQFLEDCLRWNEGGEGGGAAEGEGPGMEEGGSAAGAAAEGEGAAAEGEGRGGFLVGPDRTSADIVAWHYLCALEHHYREWYAPAMETAPRLAAFKRRIGARPRIAAYLASDACPPWDRDSLM